MRRQTQVLLAVLFLLSFLLYGIWPRDGNKLSSPFKIEAQETVSPQMMPANTPHIIPMEEYIHPTVGISEDDKETKEPVPTGTIEPEATTITAEERELLLKLTYCEANIESIECQMAVIQVVLNRVGSSGFPNSITEVIYDKGQFSPVGFGIIHKAEYNETNEEALDRVLSGEKIIGDDILFFWAESVDVSTPGTWFYKMHNNNFYIQIDHTRFYYG